VNKSDKGGKKSGGGRGKKSSKASSRKGGRKGGKASRGGKKKRYSCAERFRDRFWALSVRTPAATIYAGEESRSSRQRAG
jgi:hypothetical protein